MECIWICSIPHAVTVGFLFLNSLIPLYIMYRVKLNLQKQTIIITLSRFSRLLKTLITKNPIVSHLSCKKYVCFLRFLFFNAFIFQRCRSTNHKKLRILRVMFVSSLDVQTYIFVTGFVFCVFSFYSCTFDIYNLNCG